MYSNAHGLLAAAIVLISFLLPYAALGPQGLAKRHLGWNDGVLSKLRRALVWAGPFTAAAVYAYSLWAASGETFMARLALLAVLALAALFLWLALPPDKAVLMDLLALRPDSPMIKRAYIPRVIAMLPVAVLFAVVLAGGDRLAVLFLQRYVATLWFMLGLSVFKTACVRRGADGHRLESRLTPLKLIGMLLIWAPALWRVAREGTALWRP